MNQAIGDMRKPPASVGLYDNPFVAIARSICSSLGTRCCGVGRLIDDSQRARVLGYWDNDAESACFVYELANSPFSDMSIDDPSLLIVDGIAKLYPRDRLLARVDARSFLGMLLPDQHGRPTGIIFTLDTRPLRANALDHCDLHLQTRHATLELRQTADDNSRLDIARQLQRAQNLESIGNLAVGMAHELKNILASILGYTEITLTRYGAAIPVKGKEYLGEVLQSGERARDLMQSLLFLARQAPGTPRCVAPGPLIEESLRLFKPILPSSLLLHVSVASDIPDLFVDPIQFQQVLTTLVLEARDGLGGAGCVTIAMNYSILDESVCASCQDTFAGEFLILKVSSAEPGATVGDPEQTFRPTFTSRAREPAIGMDSVQRVVHQYGGHIKFESDSAPGATLCLYLPPAADLVPFKNGP